MRQRTLEGERWTRHSLDKNVVGRDPSNTLSFRIATNISSEMSEEFLWRIEFHVCQLIQQIT